MPDHTAIELGPKAVDHRVSLYKGVLGSIPVLGGLMAEVVGAIIPEQQIDRLKQFVEALEAKIQDLGPEQIEARFREPDFIDLLQESLTQAVRAVAQERIEHIASIVHQSLSDQDCRYIHHKKLLYILRELNDVEVLMLCGYARQLDEAFWALHREAISFAPTSMNSPQGEIDSQLVQAAHRAHLTQLNLLQPRFEKPKKGQLPDFDEKTGMMKVKSHTITALGRLLLRCIGEPDGL